MKTAQGYYPYGMVLPSYGTAYTEGYRYGFQGQEKDNEMYGIEGSSYAATFWQYDSRSGRRWNRDPVDKLWMSSYHAFSNKPILNVDPNGAVDDNYKVDKKGNITLEEKTKDKFDVLYNDKGDKTLRVEKGIFDKKKTQSMLDADGNKLNYDIYKMRGDDQSTELFEFLAKNTNVEWSVTRLGIEGDKGLNYLTTSHEKSSEQGATHLMQNQLQYGYTIREHTHNHPSNTPYPSGLDTKGSDYGIAKTIRNWYSRKYPYRSKPVFRIYTVEKGYFEYNENSKIEDFPIRGGHGFELDEIEIIDKRP